MISNYPPGAENDPSAPYNLPDLAYIQCDNCNGTGHSEPATEIYDPVRCKICDGTGELIVDADES